MNRKPGMVVVNIGDGALACGPVWEGITFSAMDQFKKLWEGDRKGGLPVIVNVVNNLYGMGDRLGERPWVMKLLPALVPVSIPSRCMPNV